MGRLKELSSLLVALAASGCAATVEKEPVRLEDALNKVWTELDKCNATVRTLPAWQVLKSKLLTDDPNPPSELEVQALLQFHHDGIMLCRRQTLENLGSAHPAFVTPTAQAYIALDRIFLRLLRREVSWADDKRAYAKWVTESLQSLRALYFVLHREIPQSPADAAVERQAALTALREWMSQQLVPSTRPRGIDCNYVGSLLKCTLFWKESGNALKS